MSMFDASLKAANKAVETNKEQQNAAPSLQMTVDLHQLECAKIHPDPNQPRKEWLPDELSELIAAIQETQGCHTPIKVRPHPDKMGEFMIVYGEGRWLSHNHLGFKTIPALLDAEERTEYTIRFEQLTENLNRKSMTRLDEANAIKGLMESHDPKLKQKEVAVKLGKPTSFISRLLKLQKAPSAVQELSSKGITQNINVLDSLTKIAELISESELENYVECVISGAISEKELQAALSDFKTATQEGGQDDHFEGMTEQRESNSVSDPLGSQSEPSGSGDKAKPEMDYGFYDYQNVYEKALFDVLFARDLAFELTEEQKDEAVDKLEKVLTEWEQGDHDGEKHALASLIEVYCATLAKDDDPIRASLNIRHVRAVMREGMEALKDTQSDNDQESEQTDSSEIAELQFTTMSAYQKFDDHVVIELEGVKVSLTLTNAELKEMLED